MFYFYLEEELVFIPRFPPRYGSLKAVYNRLPILSPPQTPCEVGRELRELCKNSSKKTVTGPRSPSWLHVEEWGIEPQISRLESHALNHYTKLALKLLTIEEGLAIACLCVATLDSLGGLPSKY